MKISKIVSVALLGAVFSQSAFAAAPTYTAASDLANAQKQYNIYKNIQDALAHAIDTDGEIGSVIKGAKSGDYYNFNDEYINLQYALISIIKELNSDSTYIAARKSAYNGTNTIPLNDSKGSAIAEISVVQDTKGYGIKIAKVGVSNTDDSFFYDSTNNKLLVKQGINGYLSVSLADDAKHKLEPIFAALKKVNETYLDKKEAEYAKFLFKEIKKGVESATLTADNYKQLASGVLLQELSDDIQAKIDAFNKGANKDNTVITLKSLNDLGDQVKAITKIAAATGFTADENALAADTFKDYSPVKQQGTLNTAVANLKKAIENGLALKDLTKTDTPALTAARIDELAANADPKKAAESLLILVSDKGNVKGAKSLATAAEGHLKAMNGTAEIGANAVLRADLLEKISSNSFTELANKAIVKDGTTIQNRKDDFAAQLKAVVDKNNKPADNALAYIATTPAGVVAQLDALGEAKTQLAEAVVVKTTSTDVKQLKAAATIKADALKAAINAGAIVFKGGAGADAKKELSVADIDAILNKKKADSTDVDYTNNIIALDNLIGTNTGTDAQVMIGKAETLLKGTGEALTNVAETLNNFANASLARANVIIATNNSNKISNEVLASLADVALSQDGYELFLNTRDGEDINDLRNSMAKSLTQAASITATSSALNTLNFNNELATNTRLASLANPFNKDLALAKAILNLKDDALADGGNSLASVVSQYSKRFSYDNNIWGNILASKSKTKNAASQSSWGVALGYDRAFDSTIVGGYLGYNKQNSKLDQARNKADSYELGVYTRSFFDAHEIDAKLSYAVASNKLSRNSYNSQQNITNDASFKSNKLGLGVDYGYVVKFGESSFVKPIIGLAYSATSQKDINENGKFGFKISGLSQKSIEAKLAAEIRSYVSENNYIYVAPGLASEIYKSSKAVTAQLNGSNRVIQLQPKAKKGTYFTVQTGGDFALSQNLSTNVNFGAKLKSGEKHLSGSVGLKYKF